MNEVHIAAVGNLASQVRYDRTDNGVSVARFRLAVTPRRFDRASGGWADGESSFYTVTCWRTLADNAAGSLSKGDPVCVVGKLRLRTWERDGARGTSAEVEASSIGHDLGRGLTQFRRSRWQTEERPEPLAEPGHGATADGAAVDRSVGAAGAPAAEPAGVG